MFGLNLNKLLTLTFVGAFLCTANLLVAQTEPPVPKKFQRFFAHYVDQRSILEKSLNLIGMTGQDVGKSFALIVGVSHYPLLPGFARNLRPAEADRDQLVSYLEKEEFFDEIVVLWDDDANLENLSFFLKEYFPKRQGSFPKSRLLFTYSGHGFTNEGRGYLLGSAAKNFSDTKDALSLIELRGFIDSSARAGYQVLVLLNACYAGAFLNNTSFGGRYLPKHPGAHAITAGAAEEQAWSDSRIGPGSVFFEKVLSGLGGAADRFPDSPDGIITATELYAYLRQEVQISTDQKQAPQLGDLSTNGQSEGEFFFLNRARQVRARLVPDWNPLRDKIRMGASTTFVPLVAPDDVNWMTFTGDIPMEQRHSIEMTLSGSFGDQRFVTDGGTLHFELAVSHQAVRYEQIELRTPFITQKFSGTFSSGFGKPRIPIELEMSFFVVVSTSHPSEEILITPSSDGNFVIAPFTTSSCNFTCYYLEVVGTWNARGPGLDANGTIRSSVVDQRGIGADTFANLDPTEYPKSVGLDRVRWHANSGGVPIPDLVNAQLGQILLKVTPVYIGSPGIENGRTTLTSDQSNK